MHMFWSNLSAALLLAGAATVALADHGALGYGPGTDELGMDGLGIAKPALGKPSAQVALMDLAPVQLIPGEVQPVTVKLSAAYRQGEMQVHVSASEPLEVIGGAQNFRFDLADGGPYHLPLELYSAVQGRHYLNISVELHSPDSPINFRALAVIINAGEAILSAPLYEPPAAPAQVRKVHSMPAHERVE